MKKTAFLLFALLLFSSCRDKIYHKYLANVPIYKEYSAFRSDITFENPREIVKHGSIYKKDDILFIVDNGTGIHFINNVNPSAPVNIGFLKIQGCTGMSIKDNYLYANHLIDLAVIDISDFNDPKVVGQAGDLFQAALPDHDTKYPLASIDKEKGVVIGWEIKETKEEVDNQPNWFNCTNCEMLTSNTSGNNGPTMGTGISGSITKFAIVNNFLYVMDNHALYSVNISSPLSPSAGEPELIWQTVETLFPYNNNLFMGTTTGMLIYSLSTPSTPTYVSVISHMTACDPVVVKDNYAYVTVRSGTACNGGVINQLDVIDISNLSNPILKQSFAMNNPHGLGIDGDLLFICDGSAGLKVFDASNPLTCGNQLMHQFSDIQATDVIPQNNIAIMIGDDGLYQYDYTNPSSIQLLSKILFN
jgi:hypothetical protein